jgi:hypothetical protein
MLLWIVPFYLQDLWGLMVDCWKFWVCERSRRINIHCFRKKLRNYHQPSWQKIISLLNVFGWFLRICYCSVPQLESKGTFKSNFIMREIFVEAFYTTLQTLLTFRDEELCRSLLCWTNLRCASSRLEARRWLFLCLSRFNNVASTPSFLHTPTVFLLFEWNEWVS